MKKDRFGLGIWFTQDDRGKWLCWKESHPAPIPCEETSISVTLWKKLVELDKHLSQPEFRVGG